MAQAAEAADALQVHVIAYRRPESLARLLSSLKAAHYDGDKVDLHLHIDAADTAAAGDLVAQVRQIANAEKASWQFGVVTVDEAKTHRGLRDMWLQSWVPRTLSERGLILEDDIELSPQYYRWLKSAHSTYAGSSSLAGISLQRLAWSPSGRPLNRLPGHVPLLSQTVSTWALSPIAEHWRGFQRFMQGRSDSASTVAKFSALNAEPGYALQAGWNRHDPKEAMQLWSPAFAVYCSSKGLKTLYPSLQPDYHALAVHWRESGTHYKRKKASADFVLAADWMPGMSTMPSFQSLVHVPFNGFAESKLHKPVSLLAADATSDAMAAYKKLEDEAAAKAGAAGGPDDTELFTDDAWQWDPDRARQLYAPSIGQLTLLCAAVVNLVLLAVGAGSRAVGWMKARGADKAATLDEKVDTLNVDATPVVDALSAGGVLATMYQVCLPCAELSFWLLLVTMAEFVMPSRERTHSPGDFWELMLILAFISILWQRPVKPAKGVASLLSRDLTSEWRGWMQAAFLMYHYCHMNEVYAFIRLLVSAYVWQTGFGNGMYFTKYREFTGERMFQMLWRLNFLVCLLVLATKTPWIAYYVCALHTVHFIMIFGFMWIGCKLLYTNREAKGLDVKTWWPWASLAALSIFCVLVWDVPKIYEYTFGIVVTWAFGADFDRELHFRTFLDHYSSCFGLLAAVAAPTIMRWTEQRPLRAYVTLGAVATALASVWFACYWMTKWDESDVAYDLIHPYISTAPLWLFVLVRGATQPWRNTVSVPLEFIGKHSLEFYLLQFHLFLSQEAGAILMIVPNKRLNIALVLPIYVLTACRTFHLTNVIKDLYFAMSSTYRLTVSTYLAFGALLAGVGAKDELPLWAMWLLGAALVCIPPLGALVARVRVPQLKRRSVADTVKPLLLLAALLVPPQLLVGSALQPIVRAGAAANAVEDIPEEVPDWNESVVDDQCFMITVPTSLLPTNSVAEACPGSDESSFNGWRSSVSDMLHQGAKARRMAASGTAHATDSADSAKGLRRAVNKTAAHGSSSSDEGHSSRSGRKHDGDDIAAETLQLMASSGGNSTATPSRHVHSDTTPRGNNSAFWGDRDRLDQLLGRLQSEPEAPLLDLNSSSNGSDHHFIVFWGDSTVRFNFKFWVELLNTELTELPDFSLTTMKANLSSYSPGNMTRPAPPDQTQYFVWHANGTLGGHQVTLLFVGGGIFVDVELAPQVLKMMDSAPYNLDLEKKATMVMVGSGGLHHLHLQPTKEWENPDKWQHLETRLHTSLAGLQTWLPKATMMYFTIHSMCDDLLIEEGWPAAANKYNSGKGKCEGVRCEEATFNRKGAMHWYSREMSVLRNKGHADRWGVVDAFKMTDGQCWATGDGRHFNPLLPQFTMAAMSQSMPLRVL
eukprot:scaffold77223_cov66-Phaeocystis_antarctica.AAC.2